MFFMFLSTDKVRANERSANLFAISQQVQPKLKDEVFNRQQSSSLVNL